MRIIDNGGLAAMQYWKLVRVNDTRARLLADRHYSRQSPGTPWFTPPGNSIVLLGLNDDALWVSHRPDPNAGLALPRMDGYEYWDNPYFRNESGRKASALIGEALAITLHIWGVEQLPPDGFHSFVDPRQVRPVMRRGRPVYGFCFDRAGFVLHPTPTKDKKLLRYIMPAERLRLIAPVAPLVEQPALF